MVFTDCLNLQSEGSSIASSGSEPCLNMTQARIARCLLCLSSDRRMARGGGGGLVIGGVGLPVSVTPVSWQQGLSCIKSEMLQFSTRVASHLTTRKAAKGQRGFSSDLNTIGAHPPAYFAKSFSEIEFRGFRLSYSAREQ